MKPLTQPKVPVKPAKTADVARDKAPHDTRKAEAQCCAKVSRIVAGCHD